MPSAPAPTRRTQAERRATTQAALLAAARELFTERGFADTGRDDIAARAGVTRGALYHHFATKADVAVAVIEELYGELVERVVGAAARGGGTALDQVLRASRAYIDACAEPAVARILLTEAPAIVGMEALRAMDAASCVPILERFFAQAAAEELGVPGRVDIAARLFLGLLDQAAAVIAADPNPQQARRRIGPTVDAFVRKLLAPAA
jgi:AcrR family transcriptional regulator